MSGRVSVSVGVFLLAGGAGLTGLDAIEALNDELERNRGTLQLWMDGIVVPRSLFRQSMRISRYAHTPYFAAIVLPRHGAWQTYPRFELDLEQITKLIAKLKKLRPKKRPGPRAEYRDKLIPQVMRSREAQRLETDDDLLALVIRKAREKGFTLPKDKRPILAEIQKHRVRN